MSENERANTDDGARNFNESLIEEFRANGGKVGGMFEGAPMLLLTTTGARSRLPRTTPLIHLTDNGNLVIFASKGGAPTNPDWFHNLRANPEVTVEIGTEKFQARATVADEPNRRRLYDQIAARMPNFAEYQKNTTRQIPVVVLERLAG